jgi:hypothetical protein
MPPTRADPGPPLKRAAEHSVEMPDSTLKKMSRSQEMDDLPVATVGIDLGALPWTLYALNVVASCLLTRCRCNSWLQDFTNNNEIPRYFLCTSCLADLIVVSSRVVHATLYSEPSDVQAPCPRSFGAARMASLAK